MIDPYAFKIWWCCLTAADQSFALQMLSIYASLAGFVTVGDYEARQAATYPFRPLERGRNFQLVYHLTPGIWEPEDGVEIPVYYFDLDFWLPFAVFMLSPESSCAAGCRELNFT